MADRTFQEGVLEGGLYKFSNSANWVEGVVPVTGDKIIIGAALACTYDVDYPAVTSVLDSDTVNFAAGTYHAPAANEVVDTAVFGAASAVPGTVHLPSAAEVIDTAVFGPASGTTGTVHLPNVGEVQQGALFGPASALSGTLAVDTGMYFAARTAQANAVQTRGVNKG